MVRTVLERLTLLAASLCLCAAAAEGVVRALDLAPRLLQVNEGRYRLSSNPLLGYEPTPDVTFNGANLYNYDWRGGSTRFGFRGNDYAPEKPSGATRIAVIGDSIASGLWIDKYEESFPGALELLLRKRVPETQLLDFGVVGYNTRQEVESLKKFGLGYRPDLVLVEYCLNDRERNDGALLQRLIDQERKRDGEGVVPSLQSSALVRSALYRLIRFRLVPALVAASKDLDSKHRFDLLSADTVDESLADLGGLAREHHFVGVVAIFPRFDNLQQYAFGAEHERVRRTAEAAGLHVIDLLPAFQRCAAESPEPLRLDEYHPSAAGHRCAAEAIEKYLVDSRFVK